MQSITMTCDNSFDDVCMRERGKRVKLSPIINTTDPTLDGLTTRFKIWETGSESLCHRHGLAIRHSQPQRLACNTQDVMFPL